MPALDDVFGPIGADKAEDRQVGLRMFRAAAKCQRCGWRALRLQLDVRHVCLCLGLNQAYQEPYIAIQIEKDMRGHGK